MMRKWSEACDQYNEPLEPAWAALMIARAAWYAANNTDAGMHPKWDVEKAGSVIRAWRKSLPDQGERMWDFSSQPSDTDLLWIALRCIGYAQGVPNATSLRSAEAALRTWWKRQQP